MSTASLFLGLISGTSADGIDVALVAFDGAQPRLLRGETYPYPDDLRTQILALSQSRGAIALDDFGRLDTRVGEAFADAALQMLAASGVPAESVAAIGSHGQTLRHAPTGEHPFTLQVGDPNLIAERCGIRVVADFRRRDVAAGGQGAPLLPALHAAVFADAANDVAVLNLGGIGNLTLLPRAGDVRGFDTGPANCLLDAWCLEHTGVARDEGGAWAAGGTIDPALLRALLADEYFVQPAPKSTGRNRFHRGWLQERLSLVGAAPAATLADTGTADPRDPRDVQATLLEISAVTIVDALRAELPDAARLIVCGGGVHNAALMQRLRALAAPIEVASSAAYGIDPDFVEAVGFAWLARATLAGLAGNLPTVTGATGPRILGALYAT